MPSRVTTKVGSKFLLTCSSGFGKSEAVLSPEDESVSELSELDSSELFDESV